MSAGKTPREFASMSEVRRVAAQSPATLAYEYKKMKQQRDMLASILREAIEWIHSDSYVAGYGEDKKKLDGWREALRSIGRENV